MPTGNISPIDGVSSKRWWRIPAFVVLVAALVLLGALLVEVLPTIHGTGRDIVLMVVMLGAVVSILLSVRLWRGGRPPPGESGPGADK
jgi:hypothetical protein